MPASQLRAVVPAYFSPATDPVAWDRLARYAPLVRLVTVNVANGPGQQPNPRYRDVIARLRQSHVDVAGYVDTGYAQRRTDTVVAEVARYLDWYGVDAVFLDQVSSGWNHLDHYADLAGRVRAAGARLLAFNHGTYPVQEYSKLAELLGTFEGPWRSYMAARIPDWVRMWPAERFFHLVYSVPAARHGDVYGLVARRGADGAYVTERGGANPWDYLPDALFDCLGSLRPVIEAQPLP